MTELSLADFYKWLKEKGYTEYTLKEADKSDLYRQYVAERKHK